ncbi:hypothetical protein A9995_14225 [Erythrobacter sp. QSSC1-22B]|nr:hypothetical protein A9995_14225 [Erythrobacter sp. QSSC1-22B]
MPSETLERLILLEIAIREQAELDDRRQSRPNASLDPTGWSVREISNHEGWDVVLAKVDQARAALVRTGLLKELPAPSDVDKSIDLGTGSLILSRSGRARASEIAPAYLGGPLRSWASVDPAFEDIGQVKVQFLGSQFVIGCVAGEEAKALRLAERFEIDAGEVTKAVSAELDDVRAMLMAGVLTYESLETLENSTGELPASDRLVGLDHNSAVYQSAVQSLDSLITIVRDSNQYRQNNEADQERRLSELEAGRVLLNSRWVSAATAKAALWGTLSYLAIKFADAPIGEAAGIAWNAIKRLIGVL